MSLRVCFSAYARYCQILFGWAFTFSLANVNKTCSHPATRYLSSKRHHYSVHTQTLYTMKLFMASFIAALSATSVERSELEILKQEFFDMKVQQQADRAQQQLTVHLLKEQQELTTRLTAQFTGVIVMFSGDEQFIPIGWQLCDGTNGTVGSFLFLRTNTAFIETIDSLLNMFDFSVKHRNLL